jgi:RNA polymerase sigma factor (sigma-70 family)
MVEPTGLDAAREPGVSRRILAARSDIGLNLSDQMLLESQPAVPKNDDGGGATPSILKVPDGGATSSGLTTYLRQLKRLPRITVDEERLLFVKLQAGVAEARNEIVEKHLWLVVLVARRLCKFGGSLEDLIAEGNIALFKAVEKFDLEKKVRFSTYAQWWVLHAITAAIGQRSQPVSMPRRVALAIARRKDGREGASRSGNERDGDLQIPAVETDEATGDGGMPPAVNETQLEENTPETLTVNKRLTQSLMACVAALSERERLVVEMRFGLNGGTICTLEMIGERLGVSAERIRKIQLAAISKLRLAMFG